MSSPQMSDQFAAWERTGIVAVAGEGTSENTGRVMLGFCGAMCVPGLGHMLAGARKRGLWWLNATVIPAIVFIMLTQQPNRFGWMALALATAIALYIAQMIDAAKWARRSSRPMLGMPAARFALSAPLLVGAIFWQHATIRMLQETTYEICYSPTDSMAPAIDVGDLFVNLKNQPAARWDIIGINMPREAGTQYAGLIKRVIGLPGETVEIKDDGLHINGKLVPPPPGVTKYFAVNIWNQTLGQADAQYAANGCWGRPVTLEEDEYFCLGDNNRDSDDSRFWLSISGHQRGALPKSCIIGRIGARIWPPQRWRVFESSAQ